MRRDVVWSDIVNMNYNAFCYLPQETSNLDYNINISIVHTPATKYAIVHKRKVYMVTTCVHYNIVILGTILL